MILQRINLVVMFVGNHLHSLISKSMQMEVHLGTQVNCDLEDSFGTPLGIEFWVFFFFVLVVLLQTSRLRYWVFFIAFIGLGKQITIFALSHGRLGIKHIGHFNVALMAK